MSRFPDGPLRILLVKPDDSALSVGFGGTARMPSLDLLMVAASVPGHFCCLLDQRLEPAGTFAATCRISSRRGRREGLLRRERGGRFSGCRQLASLYPQISMFANPRVFRRVIRIGVTALDWLHSALGRQSTASFAS